MSVTSNLHTPAQRGMVSMSSRSVRVAGLVLLAVSLAACGGDDATAEPAAEAITVNVGPEGVAVAAKTMLSVGPLLSGTLVAERTAQIRAEVSGAILAVNYDPGASVTKGTSLGRIDDRAIQDAYLGARSGFTAAQSAADLSARELSRAERLHAAGALADRDLENARRADLGARSMLDDARARLSQAEKARDAANVLAPYDGIVSERFVNPGDIVNPGTPLFAIVDPSTMRLEAAVPASELSMVRVGAPVRFSVTGYPGRTFEGRISSVNPQADPQTRQVRLFIRIPNTGQRLVAGLFAEGRVASESRETLTVPALAVDERGLTPQVVRLKNGVTERVAVTMGARDGASDRIEITSGIAAGDTVLVGAALGITVGSRVKVSTPSDTSTQR
jgi:membrane fusion protein (multidrug efflux system)